MAEVQRPRGAAERADANNNLRVDDFELLASDPPTAGPSRAPRRTSTLLTGGTKRQSMLGKKGQLDVASFSSEAFNPAAYLRSTMEADTEEAINTSLRSLTVARDKSINEIKKAVYKNHLEFLCVSKEIMRFEENLVELRSIQTELKTAANSLISAAGVRSFISLDETKVTPARREDTDETEQVVPAPLSPALTTTSEAGIRQKKMEILCELIQDFEVGRSSPSSHRDSPLMATEIHGRGTLRDPRGRQFPRNGRRGQL